MKIIIPILGFGRSGGQRVLSQLSNQWIKRGHRVDFLCPKSSDEPYFPITAGIIWTDEDGDISRSRQEKRKSSAWYNIKSLYCGLKVVGSEYDIILANHSLTAWPVALVSCGQAKKKYYVQAYEPEYYIDTKTLKGYLLAIMSMLSYHLLSERIVNAPIYFSYRNLYATKFVPPGLDLEIFKPLMTSPKKIYAEKIILIGCIGRRELSKGIIYVLKAFEILYKKDKRFRLRVAYGNLPLEWKHEGCEIIMPKNDRDLSDFYRSLDILIAPGTLQHGAPHYPVLEAGACGVTVVTTGYMGANQETAWIVHNKDAESIVRVILDLISISKHNERIKKINSFLNEVKSYSWEQVSDRMLNLF